MIIVWSGRPPWSLKQIILLFLGPGFCFESLISWILALAMIATNIYYCGGSIELKLRELEPELGVELAWLHLHQY